MSARERPDGRVDAARGDIEYYERYGLTLTQDLLGPPLPRRVHKGLDVPFWGRLQHPMPEVEHVHARPAGALDACFDGLFYFIHRTQ